MSKILDWKGHFYVGLGSLSAFLKQAGHQTSLIHISNSRYSKSDFLRDISRLSPDLIGFSSTTISFPVVERILGWMEEEGLDTPTICGGTHATVASHDAISPGRMDMICVGEGEHTLLEIVDRMERGEASRDMPGLWYKRADGAVVRGPQRPYIADLDSLPVPDRDLFDLESCFWERQGIGVFMVSRGCPFDCTYCVNHTLRAMFGAKDYVRFRSVDRVIEEIKDVCAKHPYIKGCLFDDDILFLNLAWSEEFAQRYAGEVALPFRCNVHPRLLDERRAALLKKSHCVSVKVGIESGNDFIRNQVLKRGLKDEEIMTGLDICHDYGFEITSFNMVGLPYETPETVLETIRMNVRGRVHEMQVSIFYPFPGTESYEICRENGWLAGESKRIEDFFTDSILNLPSITRGQILFFRHNFMRLAAAYRAIEKLPGPCRRPAERLFQCLVARAGVPVLFNVFSVLYKSIRKLAGVFRRNVRS